MRFYVFHVQVRSVPDQGRWLLGIVARVRGSFLLGTFLFHVVGSLCRHERYDIACDGSVQNDPTEHVLLLM
jgi:hypothetical protein